MAHQSQRACALLDQSTEAAINTSGEVTVAVGVLQDRQRRARSDVDDGTSTRAGGPHVGRNFAPEGLEVTNRLIRGDAELRGTAARQVARAPLGHDAARYGVGAGQSSLGTVGTNEVDRVGEAEGQVVRVGKDEVATADEHVARDAAGVEDRERTRTSLVDAASSIDTADRPNDAVVDVDIGNIVGILTHIQDRVHIRAIQAREEVGLRAGVEVVNVIQAEALWGEWPVDLIVTQGGARSDDIVSGALEAQRGGALEDDSTSALHAGGEAGRIRHAVAGPLVQIAGHLQGALVDDDQARESTLCTQVVRHGPRGRSSKIGRI